MSENADGKNGSGPLEAGAPVVIVGGFVSWQPRYRAMAAAIRELSGLPVHLVPLSPADWLGALLFGRSGQLVFEISTLIDKVLLESEADRVVLVGHSAGGVAARVCIGGTPPYGGRRYSGHRRVSDLITLGSPHLVRDGWPLREIHRASEQFPGALHKSITYRSVAGAAVPGASSKRAARSYKHLVGDPNAVGDGVVPVKAALLPGSEQLVLDDLYHDPGGRGKWYGSDTGTVARWWPERLVRRGAADTKNFEKERGAR